MGFTLNKDLRLRGTEIKRVEFLRRETKFDRKVPRELDSLRGEELKGDPLEVGTNVSVANRADPLMWPVHLVGLMRQGFGGTAAGTRRSLCRGRLRRTGADPAGLTDWGFRGAGLHRIFS